MSTWPNALETEDNKASRMTERIRMDTYMKHSTLVVFGLRVSAHSIRNSIETKAETNRLEATETIPCNSLVSYRRFWGALCINTIVCYPSVPFKTADKWAKMKCIMGDKKPVYTKKPNREYNRFWSANWSKTPCLLMLFNAAVGFAFNNQFLFLFALLRKFFLREVGNQLYW
jgi:hypothetical protein